MGQGVCPYSKFQRLAWPSARKEKRRGGSGGGNGSAGSGTGSRCFERVGGKPREVSIGSLVRGGSTFDFTALDRPRVRSSRGAHVPGRTRDRAPAEEAGSGKAKPSNQLCTAATAGKASFHRNLLVGRSYNDFGPRGSCHLALSCRWRFAEGWTWKRWVTSCDSPEPPLVGMLAPRCGSVRGAWFMPGLHLRGSGIV